MAYPVPDSYSWASGGVIAAGRFRVSLFYQNLAAGWTEITPTGTLPPSGILAFSGTAWNPETGKMYIGPSGGHSDYGGNEVWEFDYENRASFSKHYEPDFTAIFSSADVPAVKYAQLAPFVDNVNYPGAVVSGGVPVRPISRHTYASAVWLPHLGKYTVGGASTFMGQTPVDYWANVWPNSPKDFWFYDPVSRTFEYKGSGLINSAYQPLARVGLHETRQRLYGVNVNVGNRCFIVEYNPNTNVWTNHTELGPSLNVTSCGCAVDTLQDRVVVLMKPSAGTYLVAYSYNLSTHVWQVISTTGTAPTNLNAEGRMIYSAKTNRMLLLRGATDGLLILDLNTNTWTTETASLPNHAQTSGNWFYDKVRQVCFLCYANGAYGVRIWAYKEN